MCTDLISSTQHIGPRPQYVSLCHLVTAHLRPGYAFIHVLFYVSLPAFFLFFFFLNDTAPPEIYPLSLPDALPIFLRMTAAASLQRPASLEFSLTPLRVVAASGERRVASARSPSTEKQEASRHIPPRRPARDAAEEIGRAHV